MPEESKEDDQKASPDKSDEEIDMAVVRRAAIILSDRFSDFIVLVRPNSEKTSLMVKWSNRDWATGAFQSACDLVQTSRNEGEDA